MKTKSTNRKSKFIINIMMVAGFIGCLISTAVFEGGQRGGHHGGGFESKFSWGTSHCIISLLFVAFIFVHIYQHWGYLKAVIRKNLYWKNIILTLTSVLFLATLVSFILYLNSFSGVYRHYHSFVTHSFVALAVVHFLLNFKKLIALIKKVNIEQPKQYL